MATEKQVQANRRNSKFSTGPKSERGKRISAMNALKWGVFAEHLLLPDDDRGAFGKLRAEIYKEWNPLGPTERALAERLVALLWRQQRFYHAESGLFEMFRRSPGGTGGVATAIAKDGNETGSFTRLLRMDVATEKSIASIIDLLTKLQADREARPGLRER
jgi:hypothetical protein